MILSDCDGFRKHIHYDHPTTPREGGEPPQYSGSRQSRVMNPPKRHESTTAAPHAQNVLCLYSQWAMSFSIAYTVHISIILLLLRASLMWLAISMIDQPYECKLAAQSVVCLYYYSSDLWLGQWSPGQLSCCLISTPAGIWPVLTYSTGTVSFEVY